MSSVVAISNKRSCEHENPKIIGCSYVMELRGFPGRKFGCAHVRAPRNRPKQLLPSGDVKTTIFRYPRIDLALICQTPIHLALGAHVGFG